MKTSDIIRIEANGNNTFVFLHEGISVSSSESIDQLEEETSSAFFFKVHPEHLINLNFMSKINLGTPPSVEMCDGVIVPLQEGKQSELLKYFEKFSQ